MRYTDFIKFTLAVTIMYALVWSVNVKAETVWMRHPQMTISLDLTKPCSSKVVLNMIQEQYQSQFKAAVVVWKGKALEACWMPMPDGNVLMIDETGDRGELPASAFKRDPEV